MYRKKQDTIHINFVQDTGGLGDALGTLPCIKYVYDTHPHVVIHWWCPDYMIDLSKRSLPNDPNRLIIRGFGEKEKFKKEFYGRAFSIHKSTNLGSHTTKQAFSVIVNEEVEDKHLNYLPINNEDVSLERFSLPEKYVCITTGFTAAVREFLPQYVNEVARYVKEKGYTPVFLGKKQTYNGAGHTIMGTFKTEVDYNAGIDLIDKTSLIEAQKIMANSACVVGLDNGLIHLAATSNVPIVVGFTTVKPMHRLPYRKDVLGWNCYPVVPPESLKCRFCQSNMQFTYHVQNNPIKGHDFKTCYYLERKEDIRIQCVSQLKSELYIKELEKVLL